MKQNLEQKELELGAPGVEGRGCESRRVQNLLQEVLSVNRAAKGSGCGCPMKVRSHYVVMAEEAEGEDGGSKHG